MNEFVFEKVEINLEGCSENISHESILACKFKIIHWGLIALELQYFEYKLLAVLRLNVRTTLSHFH